jgi:hypothetical protein
LSADSRMSSTKAAAWKSNKSHGWAFPTASEAGKIVHTYLTYGARPSGAAGVWIAPSSHRLRTAMLAFLAGNVFAVVAIAFSEGELLLNLPLSLVGSTFILALMIAWVSGNCSSLTLQLENEVQGDPRSDWQRCSDRLRNSEHVSEDVITRAPIFEADHLFLGAEPWQKFPVLLHQPLLHEHAFIAGRTGSGKTSMALMQKLIQIIRGHRLPSGKWSDKVPMVIIDLKGDEVLFQTAKAEAELRQQTFRFFTLEPGKASYRFNPFCGFRSKTLTVPQLVQLNLDALNLYHGTGYGKGYFSQRSRFLLSQALRNPTGVDTFKDLYDRLNALSGERPEDFRDAFELLSVIESLTHYEQLVTTAADEEGDDTIRLERVLEEREVVYFWLPAIVDPGIQTRQ